MKKAPAQGFAKGATCVCDASFQDICGSPYRGDIEWLKSKGLTNGCTADGSQYCPNKTVSRGEMAVFLAAALSLPAGPDAFVDDDGSPYEPAINAVAKAGITSGCDAQKKLYCPDDAVSRGQMATFLHRAMEP
ncbi:MAG: S-layer homology domain-containing protein [Polyangiaceae bacterium]